MNNVLELKGKRFVQASKNSQGGGAAMNSQKTVTSEQLLRLKEQLIRINNFWKLGKNTFSRCFNKCLLQ